MRKPFISFAIAAVAMVAAPIAAGADDDDFGRVGDSVTKKECGACHMAFQAGLLPAGSWTTMMAGLRDHFGEDATLDAPTNRHITSYLTRNAGTRRRGSETLRITETRWFVDEHRNEASQRSRQRAGSMANCTACHRDAERGDYDDD